VRFYPGSIVQLARGPPAAMAGLRPFPGRRGADRAPSTGHSQGLVPPEPQAAVVIRSSLAR
jgi:hypothetical protein